MFRRSNILSDPNLPISILKDRVCQAVEQEVQNEISEYEMTDEEYVEVRAHNSSFNQPDIMKILYKMIENPVSLGGVLFEMRTVPREIMSTHRFGHYAIRRSGLYCKENFIFGSTSV